MKTINWTKAKLEQKRKILVSYGTINGMNIVLHKDFIFFLDRKLNLVSYDPISKANPAIKSEKFEVIEKLPKIAMKDIEGALQIQELKGKK